MCEMYSVLLISVTLISLSISAPASEDAQAKILSYENAIDEKGNYEFSFETSNGISRKESGKLVNVGEPSEHLEVQGVYSYPDAEGNLVLVQYTADENGYHIEEGVRPLPLRPQTVQALPSAAVATLLG